MMSSCGFLTFKTRYLCSVSSSLEPIGLDSRDVYFLVFDVKRRMEFSSH